MIRQVKSLKYYTDKCCSPKCWKMHLQTLNSVSENCSTVTLQCFAFKRSVCIIFSCCRCTVSIAARVQVLQKRRRNLRMEWWEIRPFKERLETLQHQLLGARSSRRGPASDTDQSFSVDGCLSCEMYKHVVTVFFFVSVWWSFLCVYRSSHSSDVYSHISNSVLFSVFV